MYPVPVLLEPSVRLNRLLLLVEEFQVKVVEYAPMETDRLEDGAVNPDQAVLADPEHAPKVGAPPLVDTRHRVPVPPVGVVVREVPFQNAAPFVDGLTIPPPPPVIATEEDAVTKPFALTVRTQVVVAVPQLVGVEFTVASVTTLEANVLASPLSSAAVKG